MSDWKLAPLEPTKEMCRAVCDCHDIDHQEQIVEDYRAMLAAAPAPPARPLTPAQEAAPELLEALKALEMLFSPCVRDSTQADWIDRALAAIAKAEGACHE